MTGYTVWHKLFRRVPQHFASLEEHFKYGSVGAEEPAGVPYPIWRVLPAVFPDKLKGDSYAALGATWEEGREMPIGFTKVTIGFPRVGMNCASCHVGTVRAKPGDKPLLLLGGPSTRFDAQRYMRFLSACAQDDRFNPDIVIAAMEKLEPVSWIDRILYRFFIIPQMKKTLIRQQKENLYWMDERPDWGPGRTDMNPFKLVVMRLKDDHSIGSTDVMAIWNQKAHQGFYRHADGLNTTVVEPVQSAALAVLATKDSIDIAGLKRVEDFLMELPPARYPFPVDQALANRGAPLFAAHCASCHAFGQKRTGQVIPVKEVGTDRNRYDHWTQEATDTFNRFAADKPWAFRRFVKTGGYVALSLDGIWARAPYLHNGAVPSLRDLLEVPERRPKVFYRGYDVYDQGRGGFVSHGADAERVGFRHDVTVRGNGNGGHLYGTELGDEDKQALLEYLKTL
jgi:mono/diheme cytochrome c family protein